MKKAFSKEYEKGVEAAERLVFDPKFDMADPGEAKGLEDYTKGFLDHLDPDTKGAIEAHNKEGAGSV